MTIKINNNGTLSVNTKRTKESQPAFRGKCKIDGTEYYISGWKKRNDYGEYISLAFALSSGDAMNMIKQDVPVVSAFDMESSEEFSSEFSSENTPF